MIEIKKVELADIDFLASLIKKIYFIYFCNKYPGDSFDKIFERVRRFTNKYFSYNVLREDILSHNSDFYFLINRFPLGFCKINRNKNHFSSSNYNDRPIDRNGFLTQIISNNHANNEVAEIEFLGTLSNIHNVEADFYNLVFNMLRPEGYKLVWTGVDEDDKYYMGEQNLPNLHNECISNGYIFKFLYLGQETKLGGINKRVFLYEEISEKQYINGSGPEFSVDWILVKTL
jgi:hypothetical protein